jgi:hypothetical protein
MHRLLHARRAATRMWRARLRTPKRGTARASGTRARSPSRGWPPSKVVEDAGGARYEDCQRCSEELPLNRQTSSSTKTTERRTPVGIDQVAASSDGTFVRIGERTPQPARRFPAARPTSATDRLSVPGAALATSPSTRGPIGCSLESTRSPPPRYNVRRAATATLAPPPMMAIGHSCSLPSPSKHIRAPTDVSEDARRTSSRARSSQAVGLERVPPPRTSATEGFPQRPARAGFPGPDARRGLPIRLPQATTSR